MRRREFSILQNGFFFFFFNSQFGDFYVFEVVFIGGGLGFGEL